MQKDAQGGADAPPLNTPNGRAGNRNLYHNIGADTYNHPGFDTKPGWLLFACIYEWSVRIWGGNDNILLFTRENKGMASFGRIGFVPFRLF